MENKQWYKSFPLVLCLVGIFIIIYIFIFLMGKDTLNSSDSIILTLISVILSSGISLYLGRYFSYDEALKRIKGEASKALRRIVRIKESAIRLKDNCKRISEEILYNSNLDSEQTLLLEYVNGISDGLQDLLGNIESSIDDWGDMLPDKVKGLKMAESEQLEIVNKFKNEMHSLLQEYKDKIKISKQDTAKGLKEELEQKSQEIFRELKKNITQIRTEVSPSISPIDLSASLPLSGSSIGESFMIINLGIYTKEDGSQYDCQYITLDKSAQAIGPLPPPGQVGARGVAYQVYTNNTELAKQLLAKKIGPGSY